MQLHLLGLKAKYREIGHLDPDQLEDMLQDYLGEQFS